MKNITFVLVGVIVVIVGGYFIYNSANTSTSAGDKQVKGSLTSLIASGKNLECTFEYTDNGNISSGTVFLADGAKRIRGNFNIQESGAGKMDAYLIRDGGYNYIWGSFSPQGVKSKVTEEEQGKLFADDNGVAIDENTTFDCKSWRVDATVFEKPSDVEFMELNFSGATMGASSSNVSGVSSLNATPKQECNASLCEQVPAGIAKDQCLQALGC